MLECLEDENFPLKDFLVDSKLKSTLTSIDVSLKDTAPPMDSVYNIINKSHLTSLPNSVEVNTCKRRILSICNPSFKDNQSETSTLLQTDTIFTCLECCEKSIYSIDDFDIGDPLGSGQFGRVYSARHKITRTNYALKALHKSALERSSAGSALQQELISHWLCREHPNVLGLVSAFEDDKCVYLLLEVAEGSVLSNITKQKGRCPLSFAVPNYSVNASLGVKSSSTRSQNSMKSTFKMNMDVIQISTWMVQLLNALEFLHSHNIIHRDIKLENLLLFPSLQLKKESSELKDTNNNYTLKLGDFGLSTLPNSLSITNMSPPPPFISFGRDSLYDDLQLYFPTISPSSQIVEEKKLKNNSSFSGQSSKIDKSKTQITCSAHIQSSALLASQAILSDEPSTKSTNNLRSASKSPRTLKSIASNTSSPSLIPSISRSQQPSFKSGRIIKKVSSNNNNSFIQKSTSIIQQKPRQVHQSVSSFKPAIRKRPTTPTALLVSPSERPQRLSICGTRGFAAPEVLAGDLYDHRADIFSVGVCFYTLLFNQYPFPKEVYESSSPRLANYNNYRIEMPMSTVPPLLEDLLKKLLTFNPQERLSASQALKHPWFLSHVDASVYTSTTEANFLLPKSTSQLTNVEEHKSNQILNETEAETKYI